MLYKPEIAVWEFTFRCNVNCIHCGSDCGEATRPDELSTEEALHLVEQLAELGCKNVTISGGEPFLRKDWIIVAHKVKQLGMDLCFISNGFIMNPEIAAILQKLNPLCVGISLDGGTPDVHDYIRGRKKSFERALNALNLLLDAGVYTSVVTTLQRINFNQLENIKNIILLYGVDAWQIQAATPQGRMDIRTAITERQFYEAAKFIARNNNRYKNTYITGADCFGYYGSLHPFLHPHDWRGCHAGMRAIGLESNGNVKGCLSLPGDDFIEGNVREKPLAEIWNNPDAFKFNRHFRLELLDGFCKECFYGSICRGGCTERAYGFTKGFCENPLCLFKIEQNGFSSEEQGSINPAPEETDAIYNEMSPLPDNIRLAKQQCCQ
jgi:radical SAM protein with 4Fe4S-binding SPASM domain